MIKHKKYLLACLCVMTLAVFLSGIAIGDSTTITGTINDNYQIVTDDGNVYDVEDNEKGAEVVDLVGKKITVTGMVNETDEMKVISITSYEVIEE